MLLAWVRSFQKELGPQMSVQNIEQLYDGKCLLKIVNVINKERNGVKGPIGSMRRFSHTSDSSMKKKLTMKRRGSGQASQHSSGGAISQDDIDAANLAERDCFKAILDMINTLYEPKGNEKSMHLHHQQPFDVADSLATAFDHDEAEVHSDSDESQTSELDRLRRLLIASICESVLCWLVIVGKELHNNDLIVRF